MKIKNIHLLTSGITFLGVFVMLILKFKTFLPLTIAFFLITIIQSNYYETKFKEYGIELESTEHGKIKNLHKVITILGTILIIGYAIMRILHISIL